jgi:hypothetical protein
MARKWRLSKLLRLLHLVLVELQILVELQTLVGPFSFNYLLNRIAQQIRERVFSPLRHGMSVQRQMRIVSGARL